MIGDFHLFYYTNDHHLFYVLQQTFFRSGLRFCVTSDRFLFTNVNRDQIALGKGGLPASVLQKQRRSGSRSIANES